MTPWVVSGVFLLIVAALAIRALFFLDAYSVSRTQSPPACLEGRVCKDRSGYYMTVPCGLSIFHDPHWHGEFFDEHCRGDQT